MATSRLPDAGAWRAVALLYSGRSDPEWVLDAGVTVALMRLWEASPPHVGSLPRAPALGYRGCRVIAPDREWQAFGGTVTLHDAGEPRARVDQQRRFEYAVLASAPPKLIPDGSVPQVPRK